MDNGYIKIHRKILDWEWYDDINTKILFFHILLKANWEDKKWHGIEIKRGELLTGRKTLAQETQLTEQQVRTSLNKLKSTNEITIKSTKQYSIIKAINYDSYQQQITNNPTNEQPTNNQRVTTTKELKELKELKEINNISSKEEMKQASNDEKKNKINEEVQNFLESIKKEVRELGFAYKTGKYERERIRNMITGKDFGELAELSGMTRLEFAINIIKITTKLDFWNGKIFNAETLYKHYAQVYNEAKRKQEEFKKNKPLII